MGRDLSRNQLNSLILGWCLSESCAFNGIAFFIPYFESITLRPGIRSTMAIESNQKALKDKSPKKALKPKVLKENVPRRLSMHQDLMSLGLEVVKAFLKEEELTKVQERSKNESLTENLVTVPVLEFLPAHGCTPTPTIEALRSFLTEQQLMLPKKSTTKLPLQALKCHLRRCASIKLRLQALKCCLRRCASI